MTKKIRIAASALAATGTLLAVGALVALVLAAALTGRASAAGRGGDIPLRQVDRDGISAIEAAGTCASYDVRGLTDGRLWSAWAAEAGGPAEVRMDLGRTRYLVRLDVVVGDARNPKTFRDSVRPSRLLVLAAGDRREIPLEDTTEVQSFHFDPPLETRALALVAEGGAEPGARCGAALSEVSLWEPTDVLSLKPALRAEIESRLATLLDPSADGEARGAARTALAHIGSPAATSTLLALRSAPTSRVEDLAEVLHDIEDSRGATIVNERLFRAEGDDRVALLRALAHLPDVEHVDMLTRLATRGTHPERVAAAQALGAIPGRDAERVLADLVRSDDGPTAAAAAAGLCGRGEDRLVGLLPTLLQTPIEVQRTTLACLPDELSAPAREAVRALLGDLTDAQSRAAVLARTCRPGDPVALDAAAALVNHPAADVRAAVARCVDRGGGLDATLLTLATDRSDTVRDAALAALERRGPEALGDLAVRVLDAAPRDVGPFVRVLGGLPRAARVEAALLWARYGPPDWTVEAARLLEPATAAELRAAVEGVAPDGTEAEALVRLFRARRGRWVGPACVLMADRAWREEPFVVRVFGAVGRPSDVPLLDPVVADSDPRLLDEAARALAALGGPDAVARLASLVGPERPERVRIAAVRAIGESRDDAALAPLDALVADTAAPSAVRAAALEALGRVRGAYALPVLESAFLEEDFAVRRAALLASQRIGDPRSLDLLSRAAADGDPAIRALGITLLSER